MGKVTVPNQFSLAVAHRTTARVDDCVKGTSFLIGGLSVESGVKHHKPKPKVTSQYRFACIYKMIKSKLITVLSSESIMYMYIVLNGTLH